MKRKVSLFLTLILMLSTIFSVNVFATSYPSISSSKYIEFKAQQNINVYKDTNCKTRGTSSPSKKYNASISSGDTCYIYKIEKSYIQVNYPTSSGRRTGYIKRNALFDKTAPINYISSSEAKVTVHKSSSGSCVAKGDKVWEVDAKKEFSGYKAVIYEAKSGKRSYKLGYVTERDLNKIKGNKSTQKTNTSNSDVPDSVKLEFKLTMLHNAAGELSSKKENAKRIIDVATDVELMKDIYKTFGVTTIAVATLNPAKMLDIVDTDAISGAAALTMSQSFYQSAVESHNKYLSVSQNIKTIKQADTAFKYCVDALSKYNAVINSNLDTIEKYKSVTNCTVDILESYFITAANAAIPGNEYKAILDACEIATTATQLVDLVGDKYAGYDALKNTVNAWYTSWNKIK